MTQKVIFVEASKKRGLLVELLKNPAMSRVLIFTRTKRGADKVARHIETHGINGAAIHGNKSQGQREAALDAFRLGKIRVLVATDIAARGIDVDEVSHVVNFELPNVPESYVHRIGRTARAGNDGIAISFCDGEERAYLKDIEKLTRLSIPSEDRRNDTTLAAASVEERSSPAEHRERPRGGRPGGGGRPQHAGDRNGRGYGGGRSDSRGSERTHRDSDHPRTGGGNAGRTERSDRPAQERRPYSPLDAGPRAPREHETRSPVGRAMDARDVAHRSARPENHTGSEHRARPVTPSSGDRGPRRAAAHGEQRPGPRSHAAGRVRRGE